MNRRGFTLLEIVVVLAIIGVASVMVYPKVGTVLTRQDVRGARSLVSTMHAKARASAVSRGRRTALAIVSGKLVIVSNHPVSGARDTVGTVVNVASRYGVAFTVSPARDSLIFDSRGLGTETSATTIYVSKGGYTDSIAVSSLGRIQR